MTYRLLPCLGVMASLIALPLAGQTSSPAAKAKSSAIPRNADGHVDLEGVWTNATLTPMERPAKFAGKATASDADAAVYEKSDLETNDIDKKDAPLLAAAGSAETGGYNNLFIDRGSQLARVDGVKRTSLIIDPPDGKTPPMTEEARKRIAGMIKSFDRYDSVKDRPLSERCILGFGSTSGPPMLPVLYNNNYQIVQTADTVMILIEMVHDIRIIRINGKHAPPTVHQWLGDSIGTWEGDTLVVDTTNFTDQTRFRGSTDHLHVIALPLTTPARSPNNGPSNIRFSPPPVPSMNTPAMKGITPCRTSWAARGRRMPYHQNSRPELRPATGAAPGTYVI
jgi:hypothetical protein